MLDVNKAKIDIIPSSKITLLSWHDVTMSAYTNMHAARKNGYIEYSVLHWPWQPRLNRDGNKCRSPQLAMRAGSPWHIHCHTLLCFSAIIHFHFIITYILTNCRHVDAKHIYHLEIFSDDIAQNSFHLRYALINRTYLRTSHLLLWQVLEGSSITRYRCIKRFACTSLHIIKIFHETSMECAAGVKLVSKSFTQLFGLPVVC